MTNLLIWAKIPRSSFSSWRERYGKLNVHTGQVPRDHWLEPADIAYINAGGTFYYLCTVLDGYSRFIVL